jgi:hypothetical protein
MYNINVVDISFLFDFSTWEAIFGYKEPGDIGPEIHTTQKILILEQIWIYYNYDHQKDFC